MQKCLAANIPYGLITAVKNVAEILVLAALQKATVRTTFERGPAEIRRT